MEQRKMRIGKKDFAKVLEKYLEEKKPWPELEIGQEAERGPIPSQECLDLMLSEAIEWTISTLYDEESDFEDGEEIGAEQVELISAINRLLGWLFFLMQTRMQVSVDVETTTKISLYDDEKKMEYVFRHGRL